MIDPEDASFWEHLEALRQTLVRIFLSVFLGIILILFFYKPFLDTLCQPYQQSALQVQEVKKKRIVNNGSELTYTLKKNESIPDETKRTFLIPQGGYLDITAVESPSLKLFGPLDGMITTLKIAFWSALILTSPYWLYMILLFIAPALHKAQQKLLPPFWILSLLLFFSGLLFAWTLSIPWANQILFSFNQDLGENIWGFSHYLDYTLVLLLATALAFESAVVLFFLVHLGKLSARQLSAKRRHAIVGIFIMSAILTPPDVFTQLLLAIPLMGLYELVILYAKIRQRSIFCERK